MADPAAAFGAVEAAGYAVDGEPRRKPKHFEIVWVTEGGHYELHVAADGTIGKYRLLASWDSRAWTARKNPSFIRHLIETRCRFSRSLAR